MWPVFNVSQKRKRDERGDLTSHSIPTWFLYPYILPCQLVAFFSREENNSSGDGSSREELQKDVLNTRRPAEHQKNNPDSTILYCITLPPFRLTAYFVLKEENDEEGQR